MTQWDNLLENLGAWSGSFTQLTAHGDLKNDQPSQVTLEGLNGNRMVRQTIQFFSADRQSVVRERVLEYSTLNRSAQVFDTGAFSQGSMQYGPFSEFGAELGFKRGDRRLRLVQLFNREGDLETITLIREHRKGTDAAERPPLTPEHLVGDWQGKATILGADFSILEARDTALSVRVEGQTLIEQGHIDHQEISRVFEIHSPILKTDNAQLLLMADGASSLSPRSIPRQESFTLEAGWLIEPDYRQRLIRQYDASGAWTHLTLIQETKVASG